MYKNDYNIPDRKKLKLEYKDNYSIYEKILDNFESDFKYRTERSPLRLMVKKRVKSFDSYYFKLLKRLKKTGNSEEALKIHDLLGIRFICPFQESIITIEDLIKENYDIVESERKGGELTFKEFGYVSIHHLVKVPEYILNKNGLKDEVIIEIQLCTTLQDAWAEVEHELVYKSDIISPFDDALKRKLAALNANLTLADILFQEILDYQKKLKMDLRQRKEAFLKEVDEKSSVIAQVAEEDGKSIINEMSMDISQSPPVDDRKNDNTSALLLEALDAHNSNEFMKAIELYSMVLEKNIPQNILSIVYTHRGMAFFAKSDYEQSISDFSNALEIKKDNFKALFYRGIVQRVLRNYQFALQDLNQCIEIDHFSFASYFNRAQVYYNMNDYSQALADCEQALKIEPDSEKILKLKVLAMSGIEIMNMSLDN